MNHIAFTLKCLFFTAVGWFVADLFGWDIISLIESGSTDPIWSIQSMNHEAERWMDWLIHSTGSLLGFCFASYITAVKLIVEDFKEVEIEDHLITE